jgi:hypothetical protein
MICFTSTWDKIELPKDSTILDFAFKIHTKIWNRVTWAWINWEYVENLIQILNNWDKVHLSLSEKELEYPVRYISFLKTKSAKKNLKNSFKNKSISKIKSLWKHLLNEKMELLWYKSFEKMPLLIQNIVIHSLNINNINDLYLNIWTWNILIDKIINIIYNTKFDESKYKSIVWLKITFKQKSPDNINALFKVFHDLDINIININYKWTYTDAEINVKNLSLLRDLLVEISRIPNVLKVKRVLLKKMIIFLILLTLISAWIIISPIVLIFIENYYNFSNIIYKSLFYINIWFFVSLLYFFKYIVKATLPWLIKQKFFWMSMLMLNTFILATVIRESIYIFDSQNSIFLFSLVILVYWLTTFEYLDSKINNQK